MPIIEGPGRKPRKVPMLDLATDRTTCCNVPTTYFGGTQVCRCCQKEIRGYVSNGEAL